MCLQGVVVGDEPGDEADIHAVSPISCLRGALGDSLSRDDLLLPTEDDLLGLLGADVACASLQ